MCHFGDRERKSVEGVGCTTHNIKTLKMDFKRNTCPKRTPHTRTLNVNHKQIYTTNLSWKPWISVYFRYLQFDNDRHPHHFARLFSGENGYAIKKCYGTICVSHNLWLLLFIRFVRFFFPWIYYFLDFYAQFDHLFVLAFGKSRDSIKPFPFQQQHRNRQPNLFIKMVFPPKCLPIDFTYQKMIVRWYYLLFIHFIRVRVNIASFYRRANSTKSNY